MAAAGSNAACTAFIANWAASAGATNYYLDVSTDIGFGSFVGAYNDLDVGNATSLNVTGLSVGTIYYYRVRAGNTCGTSGSSGTITYATLDVPAAPVATAGSGATCNTIDANWNTVAGATTYRLDVSIDPAFGSFVGINNNRNVGNVTTFNVTGLTTGVTYYYRVRAENACGSSANSNDITYATLVIPSAPVADPESNVTCSTADANWEAEVNATSYSLDVSTDINFGAGTFVFGFNGRNVGNVTTYPITGLAGNTTYYYRVRANNACGNSGNSNVITFTTSAAPTAVAGTDVTTCSNSGAVNITAGSSATNQVSVAWTSSGTGTFANANSLTTATYTPSAADISAGSVTLTLTAIGGGSCTNATSTKTLTITAAPVATFSYAGSPYCANAANPSPTFSGGGVAGTFSSTAGLNFVSTATGQVDLATSTPGTYTVTNTIAASGGCAQVIATSSITITELPVATFSYTGTPYCSNAANPLPIFSGGGVAGTFSSTAGLNFVSTATGQINLATSTPGTYTVTNTIAAAGGCGAVVATSSITITALPAATFSYTGTPYCQNAANPSPTFSGGGVAGTFTAPAGLSINAATGVVNLAASTPGTYTVTNTIAASGGCGAVVATSSITVTALPAATFSYTGTPYCQNAANPSPTFSGGGVAGTFTAPAGLSINAATGVVNLAASTPGTYTVTNTIAAANGCGVVTATSQITITKLPVATFSYTGTPYCKNAANPSPTYSGGGVAGTFSASPAGLNFVSTATGQINLATSTPGTYTVTNTIAASGGCAQVTATSSVTITAVPVATFSYTGTPYCSNAANPSPTFSGGGVAGTFSSTAGLVFVSTATGQVNLATSTPGTYTVTNTIAAANGCGVVTATSQITITKLPVATFSYTGTPYCKNAANPSPTYSGGGVAGTFSASPAGLNFVSTATGQINLATSTPGTYTVTNTIAASGGCAQVTATSSVTITAVPVATFSYTGTPYCSNAANPSPTFSGGGVAGTFSSTAGLVFVSTATGQVNLATSTAGTYTVTNTIAAANGCGIVTATSNIVINTAPSISGQPTDQTTCAGTAKTFSVTATGTSRTYQWQYSPDNVGWTNVANGTPANITYANTTTATLTVTPAAAAANGTYYYRCVVSVSGCSSINSNSATLTVSATPTTANAGADQTICTTTASVTLAANTPAAGKGTGTWSVVSGPNTSLTQFSNINSPTATFTPAGGAGTYVLRWTISNGACTASTDNVNIIVNAAPVINSQPNNQTTCAGTAKTFGVTLSAGTSPTYQWQYSPNNVAWSNVANGTPANITYGGATGATLTVTPSAAAASGTYYYRCIVSVNGCSAVTSNFATLTVNINATITLTSAAGTNAQTVCQNTPIINITYAIGGSGTGASITSGSFPAGVAGNYSAGVFTISGTPTAAGTFNYTITAMGQCTQGTASGTITVTAGPTGAFTATETSGTANNDNIICTGAAVIFTAPSGYGAYTFYVNGIKVQGPNTSNTYSTSTLNNGDQVTVDVANAANCGATFGPITITVNPLPTPTLVADKNPVCAGDLVTFTATGGTSYNFKVNGLSQQSGASATYATTTLANNDAVTVDATNANGCIGTSLAVFMTVNPLPTGTLTCHLLLPYVQEIM